MGRGGYRFGAGRPGYRLKAEACLRLDVRQLARRDLLRPCTYAWRWTNDYTGEEAGAISITASTSALRLNYSANGQPVSERVSISRTPCHFGGTRPWLHCPRCPARVAILYLRGGRFVCRHCARVAYSSQCEDEIGRAWRRQAKLEARLGDGWARPKGMHHRTHERTLARIFKCEEIRECSLAAFLARLDSSFGQLAGPRDL